MAEIGVDDEPIERVEAFDITLGSPNGALRRFVSRSGCGLEATDFSLGFRLGEHRARRHQACRQGEYFDDKPGPADHQAE